MVIKGGMDQQDTPPKTLTYAKDQAKDLATVVVYFGGFFGGLWVSMFEGLECLEVLGFFLGRKTV